jgi:hypothetical protein
MRKRQAFTILSLSLLLVVVGAYALMASDQAPKAAVDCNTSCDGSDCGSCGDCGGCAPGDCAGISTCATGAGAALKCASIQRASAGCAGPSCAPGQGCAPQVRCSAGARGASLVRVIAVRDAKTGRVAYYAVPVSQLRALKARSAGKAARAAIGPDVAMATSAQVNANPVR